MPEAKKRHVESSGKPGRKKGTVPLHDLHVHINRDIYKEVQARSQVLKITFRKACEKALELFLIHEDSPEDAAAMENARHTMAAEEAAEAKRTLAQATKRPLPKESRRALAASTKRRKLRAS